MADEALESTPLAQGDVECAVMFVDIADSTAVYDQYGDVAAQRIIGACLARMGEISAGHGGILIKTIGDELLCSFPAANQAVDAACRINEQIEGSEAFEGVLLSVHIGLHFGATVWHAHDVYGDAVNIAARMTEIAQARQIIATGEIVARLDPERTCLTRRFDVVTVKGKTESMPIFEVLWEKEDVTHIISRTSVTRMLATSTLRLRYATEEWLATPHTPSMTIGRGAQCDVVVAVGLASRVHVRIEYRRGKFVLVDQSTNGTFVKTEDGKQVYLRREELPLWGHGAISLGEAIADGDEHLIEYLTR